MESKESLVSEYPIVRFWIVRVRIYIVTFPVFPLIKTISINGRVDPRKCGLLVRYYSVLRWNEVEVIFRSLTSMVPKSASKNGINRGPSLSAVP